MTSYLITLLFIKANLINFTLDVLCWSGTHYMLVDSKQNRYLYFLIAKQPCEVAAKLSEVWVGILNNKFEPNIHFSADTLKIIKKPYLDHYSRKYSQ